MAGACAAAGHAKQSKGRLMQYAAPLKKLLVWAHHNFLFFILFLLCKAGCVLHLHLYENGVLMFLAEVEPTFINA